MFTRRSHHPRGHPSARSHHPRGGVTVAGGWGGRRVTVVPVLLVLLALIVAVAAATRSTWSPCGLSMLSTITPMAEQSRGHRYGVTATWFILGAGLGGL